MIDQQLMDEIDKKVAFLGGKINEFKNDLANKLTSLSVYEKMPHLDARQQQHKEDLMLDVKAINFNLKRYDIKKESLENTKGRINRYAGNIINTNFNNERYPMPTQTKNTMLNADKISLEQMEKMARHDLAEADHIWDIDKDFKADIIAEYDKQIEQGLAMKNAGDYDHSNPITDVVGLKHKTEIDQITDRVIDRMENRDKLTPLSDDARATLEGLKKERANDKAVQALGNNESKHMSVGSVKKVIDKISASRRSEPKTNEKGKAENTKKDISD